MNISGVRLIDLAVYEDDRGILYEVIHKTDPFVEEHGIGQVYMVRDRTPFTVRAFHRHDEKRDWLCIVAGTGLFVLVSENGDDYDRLVLSGDRPHLLVVPPRVWHGWMSLELGALMLSATPHVHDKRAPDVERVPPNHFDELIGFYPWAIQAH